MSDLSDLLQWASVSQGELIRAVMRTGSRAEAAKELGITRDQIRSKLKDVRRKAARSGYSPAHDMTRTVPEGYHVKGVSTYYGEDGKPRGQWVKSQADQEHKLLMLAEAVRDIAEPFKGKSQVTAAPKDADADLLTVYPMGDPHLGMYAWAAETGTDFNLDIAEANLVGAVDRLVWLAPKSERGMVINLGDFFHSDTPDNRTARSGHALDVDTRWSKVLGVGVRAQRRCIDLALRKHQHVDVFNLMGNHDDNTSVMLGICLAQFYENNPRVTIHTEPTAFHYHRFGENLVAMTHGDNVKPDKLPGIMATDRPEDWGATKHRFWYTGHVHHDSLREYPGCVVETFRTLAARDAWHTRAGYRSGRDMKCDVLHKTRGRILRHTVGVEELAA